MRRHTQHTCTSHGVVQEGIHTQHLEQYKNESAVIPSTHAHQIEWSCEEVDVATACRLCTRLQGSGMVDRHVCAVTVRVYTVTGKMSLRTRLNTQSTDESRTINSHSLVGGSEGVLSD